MPNPTQSVVLMLTSIGILTGCGAGESFYPLKEDLHWEYEVSLQSQFGGGSMPMAVSTMSERSLDGQQVTPFKTELGGQTFFTYVGEGKDGFYILGQQTPTAPEPELYDPPRYLLRRPVVVGLKWTSESKTQLVQEGTPVTVTLEIQAIDDTVTVPAGTFEGCVKVVSTGQAARNMGAMALGTTANISIEGVDWYAPGVGWVRSVYKETSNHLLAGSGEMNVQLKTASRGATD